MEVLRKKYLEKLNKLKAVDLIKVITGIRRCGKTTLLLQFIEELKKEYKQEQIIYINFDDKENRHLLNINELEKFLDSKISRDKQMFLFCDEIQNVIGFEELILSYYSVNKNVDIYLTGSNSHMISNQIATKFTGREINIKVLPLSFMEFYELHNGNENNKYEVFNKYVKSGAFPIISNFLDENELVENTLTNIIDTILLRDLIPHFKIKNIPLLKKILTFVMENIGNQFSVINVVTYLKNNNIENTSVHTIENYLDAIVQCFLIIKIERLDIKGLKILKKYYKFFAIDLKLRNILCNKNFDQDRGRCLENIILLNLYNKFNKINVGTYYYNDNGKMKILECDFVCQNNSDKVFIQICDDILLSSVYDREINILHKIKNGRKILINNSRINQIVDGVEIIDIVDFLLKGTI
ncbi:MAG: ATP-binding protein [Mycoplasmataceae bacterium]|jgi:predicted AAA+ superfamily ATPase|nr:ATP-binding protein [Mycoplasmataceae bacterium]